MSDWSSKSKSPNSIWKILSTENPNLDKSYFVLPNGSWDISRLNDALSEHQNSIRYNSSTQYDDSEIRFFESQQIQQNQMLSQQTQQAQYQQITIQKVQSNKINFNGFNLAVVIYIIPAFIQLFVILIIAVDMKQLFNLLPLILLCNLVMWISVPLMSKSLVTQIIKLERKIKQL